MCFRTVGQTSQAASTGSNAEDYRLTRLAENSPDSEASESLGLSFHTNGNTEGHSEEEEEEIHQISIQDVTVNGTEEAKTDDLTNNRKTKKLHEVIYINSKLQHPLGHLTCI